MNKIIDFIVCIINKLCSPKMILVYSIFADIIITIWVCSVIVVSAYQNSFHWWYLLMFAFIWIADIQVYFAYTDYKKQR